VIEIHNHLTLNEGNYHGYSALQNSVLIEFKIQSVERPYEQSEGFPEENKIFPMATVLPYVQNFQSAF
jgi:hypothetical protein